MHMADALITPAVGGIMLAISMGNIGHSTHRLKQNMDEKLVPLMGVMGAFIFASQMINFTIPGTGSSGHIGGGILLAALLGPHAAFLSLSGVLLIQSLLFADGGLLALGCNIFNLGFIPCFIAYPLIFQRMTKPGLTRKRMTAASILAVVVGLQLGSMSVIFQTLASGITDIPLGTFALLMQPIHLAIGLVEGIVTAAILNFIFQTHPHLIEQHAVKKDDAASIKGLVVALGSLCMIVGGFLSLFASESPDGLEWSLKGATGLMEFESTGIFHKVASQWQQATAYLPDYTFKNDNGSTWIPGTSFSGLVGGAVAMVLIWMTGRMIVRGRRKAKC